MDQATISKKEAVDLWAQMLDRAKSNEWSTFVDPNYTETEEDAAKRRRAFLKAGWSKDEIEIVEKAQDERNSAAPITSAGVSKQAEFQLDKISRYIKNAAVILNIKNQDKVHFAVEPKAGPFISKINVVMTDQSIITMGSFFTRYCGLIARAYTRTILLAPMSVGTNLDEALLRSEIRKNPDLLIYWWRIFVSFSLTGTQMMVPFKPSSKHEILLMEQIAISMEIFGLAHEYAHHALDHGRIIKGVTGSHQEEFEADAFAVKMCKIAEEEYRFEYSKFIEPNEQYLWTNPYLWTGAGGILLLASLEIYRKTKDKIFANKTYDTHPSFLERSVKIKAQHIMQPESYATSLDFCGAAENVLRCVMLELEPIMEQLNSKIVSDFRFNDWELESNK